MESISLSDIPAAGIAPKTIAITSNVAWTITGMTNWCNVEPASGKGNETVTVTINANENDDPRNTKLVITATGFTPVEITVTQLADNVLNSIKDANFKKWIKTSFMEEGQTRLTAAQAAAITEMYIDVPTSSDIASLEGIESFTGLKKFTFKGSADDPKPIDVAGLSSLKNVTDILITATKAEKIEISGLPELTNLNCSKNPALTTFTVEDTPKLKNLYINDTSIESVVIKNMPDLESVSCGDNAKMTEFTLINAPKTTGLDLRNTTAVTDLHVEKLGLTRFDYAAYEKVESITVKDMPNLTLVNCGSNSNMKEFTLIDAPKMTEMNLGGTSAVTDLHVEKLGLTRFEYWGYKKVESITIKGMSELTDINIYGPADNETALKTVTIDGNSKLKYLNCSRNSVLTGVTLTGSPNLETYYCDNTKLGPELDLSEFTKLNKFIGSATELTKIYVWWDPKETCPISFSAPDGCEVVQKKSGK